SIALVFPKVLIHIAEPFDGHKVQFFVWMHRQPDGHGSKGNGDIAFLIPFWLFFAIGILPKTVKRMPHFFCRFWGDSRQKSKNG
ncbi:MAG: hypothetical protein IKZ22_08675, partial [Kiritimatiellae bacterium]|nr:hypothetical protein [Kiritimatiellia bacterium]